VNRWAGLDERAGVAFANVSLLAALATLRDVSTSVDMTKEGARLQGAPALDPAGEMVAVRFLCTGRI
jgi:hypothetical protein